MPSPTHPQLSSALRLVDLAKLEEDAALAEGKEREELHTELALEYYHLGVPNKAEHYAGLIEEVDALPPETKAQVSFIRAVARQDWEGVLAAYRPHVQDPKSPIHAKACIETAHTLIEIGRYGEVQPLLEPLLEPPGVEQTLPACLLLIEANVCSTPDKDKLIEWASIADALLEKGFRVSLAQDLVYYAYLMQRKGVEALVEPLLRHHESLLDGYSGAGKEEIHFLLDVAEEYKIPGAVRAAGAAYMRNPFPWTERDPKEVSMVFASHEEHEAAYLSIRTSFKPSQIKKRRELWGPMILSSYLTGRWKEALTHIQEHKSEIQSSPELGGAIGIQIDCEYHLGRYREAAHRLEEYGIEDYVAQEDPIMAASAPFIYWALGDAAKAQEAIWATVEINFENPQFRVEFISRTMTELYIREKTQYVDDMLQVMEENSKPGTEWMNLAFNAQAMIDWAFLEGAEIAAERLRLIGELSWYEGIRGMVFAQSGNEELFEKHFNIAWTGLRDEQKPSFLLKRAMYRRRFEKHEKALEDLDLLLREWPDFPLANIALGLKAGILHLELEEDHTDEAQDLLTRAQAFVDKHARSPDEQASGRVAYISTFRGEAPATLMEELERTIMLRLDTPEILRLARRIARSFDSTPEEKTRALEIIREWEKKNLRPLWP